MKREWRWLYKRWLRWRLASLTAKRDVLTLLATGHRPPDPAQPNASREHAVW
jgi:hypothetical protein